MILLRVLYESVLQAWQQLLANKLRTFLSLLGITIGIFSVIFILSAVDSLENEIISNFSKLGNDVIYVSKQPWNENPSQNYWKYIKRPYPDYDDYLALKNLKYAESVTLSTAKSTGNVTFHNNSVSRVFVMPCTYDYNQVYPINLAMGRYFNLFEYKHGSNKAIIGHDIAEALFGQLNPLNKEIEIQGRKYEVIGVFAKEGESIINVIPYDYMIMITWENGKKLMNYNSRVFGQNLAVKARNKASMEELKDEIVVKLRAERQLKPKEENNFALNELSILAEALKGVFGVLSLAGILIGGFAILVGMFSVANIMFVSVKERVNIIGIKKALGAPSYIILIEFLLEAIVLCIIGGLVGLTCVYLAMLVLNQYVEFAMFLSFSNVVLGIGLSVVIGVLSGFIPAYRASRMNPVDAIRQ